MMGIISTFGGLADVYDLPGMDPVEERRKGKGMSRTEGLALYEHAEADQRTDLFLPRDPEHPEYATNCRLRPDGYYFASRYDHSAPRRLLQNHRWIFTHPSTGRKCAAWLVDWGPAERLNRFFDIAPAVAAALGVNTGDTIDGRPV